ncbi:DUF2784 domain-containing protein [Thermobifida halotolerans]|uniref:DUF2784 domain-containing protein n=1 Tax=Thermobifida halotolerans TaxID=483545 RepID=A0A399G459_9ACTN|nr:DUF2784 domain-containing protein [Thermobifida halotolerans]UOE20292.1 DUF2784 domain-containing protein [Thermobifida halotolerans]
MVYALLADAAMVVHFAFLAYLVCGGFLVWRWPKMIWPHLAAAAYGLGIAVIGWPCPLTWLEEWARARAGQEGLDPGGFISHYLTGVVYPAEHLPRVQLAVAVVVVLSWIGAWFARRRARRRPRSPSSTPH